MKNLISSFFLLFIILSTSVTFAEETFDIKFKDTSLLKLKYDEKCKAYTATEDKLKDLNLDLRWLSSPDDSLFQDFCVVQLKEQKQHFYKKIDEIKLDYNQQIAELKETNLTLENKNLTLQTNLSDARFKTKVILITSTIVFLTVVSHAYIF